MADENKSLIVEGWRFINHSYCVVNQWQLLAMLRRSDIYIQVVDVPYPYDYPNWRPIEGLFANQTEDILKALPIAHSNSHADVTLRISVPYDFSLARSKITAVFGTSEFKVIPHSWVKSNTNRSSQIDNPKFKIVTPSKWSAQGFLQYGFSPEQVLIIPHGVDVATFYPRPEQRSALRKNLNLDPDNFVFLNVGGVMTRTKGIDVLLKAFSIILDRHPHVRLVLKGSDEVYPSRENLLTNIKTLSVHHQKHVFENLRYIGISTSHSDMASLYQIADVYVAPYRAEGFNIPVLEAVACGIPAIVTSGGPTDDFVTGAFSRRIDSTETPRPVEDVHGAWLEPNVDHLIDLMDTMLTDEPWRRTAAISGPLHISRNYTWDLVVEKLVDKLWAA